MHALSFDVEEYFHSYNFDRAVSAREWATLPSRVELHTRRILTQLDAARYRATFFILGWVADRHPDMVKAIASAGHEVASHGQQHRLVYTQAREDFREDVRRAKSTLEDLTGTAVRGYRAPTYSIVHRSLWALDVLAEEGYGYDSSIYPVRHDRYGIPDAPRYPFRLPNGLVEFPLSTWTCAGVHVPVAGGGYFRLLPYPAVKAAFRSIEQMGRSAIFYLHPWDLDPGQPAARLPPVLRFRQTVGAKRAEGKLARLLSDFQFAPVAAVLDGMAISEARLCE